jgi:hypothetical protein
MARHFAILSGYDDLLERADWFRRIQLEYVYHFIPATGHEPRVVDPRDVQTAGYDDDQCVPSPSQRKAFSYHYQQGTVSLPL